MWITGILTIVFALFFDLSRYESFLLAIGAFFTPLFALLLTDYFVIRKQDLVDINFLEDLKFTRGFRISGLIIWAIGSAVFFAAQKFNFVLGGSITSFLVTALLTFVVFTLQSKPPTSFS